jgi:hypothetical protein
MCSIASATSTEGKAVFAQRRNPFSHGLPKHFFGEREEKGMIDVRQC